MLIKQVEATVTQQDEGIFEALASTYGLDRQGERVAHGAFKETLRRWQDSDKMLPLAWNHQLDAANLIGEVDPSTTRETPDGLLVKGQLDLEDSSVAEQAWRSVKSNRVGLSIGYLIEEERVGEDGVRELLAVDLIEVSLTASPSNDGTKILRPSLSARRSRFTPSRFDCEACSSQ